MESPEANLAEPPFWRKSPPPGVIDFGAPIWVICALHPVVSMLDRHSADERIGVGAC